MAIEFNLEIVDEIVNWLSTTTSPSSEITYGHLVLFFLIILLVAKMSGGKSG